MQKVSKARLRSAITHVALITDRNDVQPLLPQILLSNEHVVPKAVADDLAAILPPNVYLWREKSSWTNHDVMVRIIKMLGESLSDLADRYQVVLSLDCASQHIHWRIARAAASSGIWMYYVPAGLTWLLQPCDTHVFGRYKRFLGRALQNARTVSPDGQVSTSTWLRCVLLTIRKVLQGNHWGHAFAATGVSMHQAGVSSFVKDRLGGGEPALDVPDTRPTPDNLASLFPKRCKIPHRQLFHFAAPPAMLPAILDDPAPPPKRWALRDRGGPPVLAAKAACLKAAPTPKAPPAAPPPGKAPPVRRDRVAEALAAAPPLRLRRPRLVAPGAGTTPAPISSRTRSQL